MECFVDKPRIEACPSELNLYRHKKLFLILETRLLLLGGQNQERLQLLAQQIDHFLICRFSWVPSQNSVTEDALIN